MGTAGRPWRTGYVAVGSWRLPVVHRGRSVTSVSRRQSRCLALAAATAGVRAELRRAPPDQLKRATRDQVQLCR